MPPLALWALLIWNALTFALYGIDKHKARRGSRRMPEAHLLWPLAFGGLFGGWLGMSVFRHKTRKVSFRVKAVLASLVNAVWLWLWIRSP